MRKALFLAVALVACATNDADTTDSAAGAVDGPAPLTAADIAGTWSGSTVAEGSDSVVNRWTSIRESDTTGKYVSVNSPDTVRYSVVYDADSMVATSQPFTTSAIPNAQVIFRSVGRLRDGKLVGTSATMLAANPDSVVARGRWEATRNP